MPKSDVVSERELKSYVETYLRKYKEIAEENLNLIHDIGHVFFKYNNIPKEVYGVVSKNHGAAVAFKYDSTTNKTLWDYKIIEKPIEYHFWPNMSSDLSNLKVVKIAGSESPYVLNSQISIKNFALLSVSEKASLYYVGESESPFKIEGEGAVIIFGELVSRSGLIIKGANTKQAWSTYQAGLDALKHFFWDCGNRFNETIIKQIEVKHKVPLLLEKINENINNKYYKDHPEDFYNDLHELERLGLSEEMKTLIWDKYSELTREPTLWEKITSYLLQKTSDIVMYIILTVIGIIIGYRLRDYTKT